MSTNVMSVHVHVVRWVANGNQFKKASLNTDMGRNGNPWITFSMPNATRRTCGRGLLQAVTLSSTFLYYL